MLRQEVHVVIFAVHLDQVRRKTSAHLAEDGAKPLKGISIEDPAAIFRHKDRVDVQLKNAVPSVPNVIVFGHRPSGQVEYLSCNASKPTNTS
jgi:hypothetical protein